MEWFPTEQLLNNVLTSFLDFYKGSRWYYPPFVTLPFPTSSSIYIYKWKHKGGKHRIVVQCILINFNFKNQCHPKTFQSGENQHSFNILQDRKVRTKALDLTSISSCLFCMPCTSSRSISLFTVVKLLSAWMRSWASVSALSWIVSICEVTQLSWEEKEQTWSLALAMALSALHLIGCYIEPWWHSG